jgi:hypothetical protein
MIAQQSRVNCVENRLSEAAVLFEAGVETEASIHISESVPSLVKTQIHTKTTLMNRCALLLDCFFIAHLYRSQLVVRIGKEKELKASKQIRRA